MGEIDYTEYIKRYIRLSKVFAVIGIILAVTVLIGWILDIEPLRTLSPGSVNMNPLSAVVFIIICTSIILYKEGRENRLINLIVIAGIIIGLIFGVVTELNNILSLNLNVDTLLFANRIASFAQTAESRIVPNVSLGLILISSSLICLYFKLSYKLSNVLAFIALLFGWLGILGRLYDVKPVFTENALFVPTAFSASLVIFFVAFAILNMAPDKGFVRLISNDNIAGSTSRLLIFSSFIITAILGLVGLSGVNSGAYPNDLGVLYFVVLNSLLFLFLFYYSGIVINKEEIKRKVGENLVMTKSFELEKNKINLEKNVKELESTKIAVLNILEDLNVEKETLVKEKDKIAAILESIGDAVFVVDKDYKITIFNKVAVQLSGYSLEQAIGKDYTSILKFIYEKNKEVNDKFVKECIEKGITTAMANHTLIVSNTGKEIPVSDSAAPLKDSKGNVIGCVVVFRDVSKEREVDKAKTEFVSLASHQLRTPLSAINWYAEMLRDGDAGEVNPGQKEFIAEILNGSKRMVSLVNSFLNVSRIDVGTFAIDPVPTDIVEVAKSLVKEMQVTIKEKELNLNEKYEEIPVTPLDPNLIRIVIQNILSNAIKYTEPKKSIELSITKDSKDILITVKDEGYGIPKQQQDKIFQKLFRADNVREKDVEGTGLGLYIVKSIVESSGGTIRFESEENKGTTFHITIPLIGMKKKEGSKGLTE